MKKITQKLMSVMLLSIFALLPQTMRGETKITYDFTKMSATDIRLSAGTAKIRNNKTDIYLPAQDIRDFHNRFYFQFRNESTWTLGSAGLKMKDTKDVYFSITNLSAGDRVTISFTSKNIYGILFTNSNVTGKFGDYSNSYTVVENGVPEIWDQMFTENTYTVNKDGQLDLQLKKNETIITKIVITTEKTESVSSPTIATTGANGNTRTISITKGASSFGSSVKTYYTTDGTDPSSESTEYTDAPFTIDETKTIKAVSISSTGVASDIASTEIAAGTKIQLIAPYRTTISHEGSITTLSLNSNQSGVTGNPTATIAYTINDGAETEIASGTTITVNDGEKLTYYAKANGYDKSINVVETATALYSGNTIWKETYANTGDNGISRGSIAFDSWYYNIIADKKKISERLLATNQSVSNWIYRTSGIYCGNHKKYALLNMKAGQNITFTGKYVNGNFYIGTVTNLEKDEWNSVPGEKYIFNVVADGNVEFQVDRYASLNGIEVKDASLPSTVSLTVSSAGLATYTPSYNLDFSSASNITAYKAAVSGTAITLTKVTTVAAGEGVLLRGKAGEETTEAIAVATSATTANAGNEFVPVTGEIDQLAETDGDYTNFVLNKVDGVVGFYKANNTHVAAGKAYLKVLTSTLGTETGKSMKLVFGDETTGITEVSNAAKASDKAYYTLSGQRVNAPVKGLYLHNGKKVIIK